MSLPAAGGDAVAAAVAAAAGNGPLELRVVEAAAAVVCLVLQVGAPGWSGQVWAQYQQAALAGIGTGAKAALSLPRKYRYRSRVILGLLTAYSSQLVGARFPPPRPTPRRWRRRWTTRAPPAPCAACVPPP